MENFFYEDSFCSALDDLLFELDLEEEDVEGLPEDWKIEAFESVYEPIVELSADWIFNRIDEERFSVDGNDATKTYELLGNLDFKTTNEGMPKLYYPTNKKITITKKDLLEYIK